jgi:hypothetical protein
MMETFFDIGRVVGILVCFATLAISVVMSAINLFKANRGMKKSWQPWILGPLVFFDPKYFEDSAQLSRKAAVKWIGIMLVSVTALFVLYPNRP